MHICNADEGGPEYEIIREGGLAGRSKAPREEIALKECPTHCCVWWEHRGGGCRGCSV